MDAFANVSKVYVERMVKFLDRIYNYAKVILIIFTKVLYIVMTVFIQDYRLFWQHHLRQLKVLFSAVMFALADDNLM